MVGGGRGGREAAGRDCTRTDEVFSAEGVGARQRARRMTGSSPPFASADVCDAKHGARVLVCARACVCVLGEERGAAR